MPLGFGGDPSLNWPGSPSDRTKFALNELLAGPGQAWMVRSVMTGRTNTVSGLVCAKHYLFFRAGQDFADVPGHGMALRLVATGPESSESILRRC